MSDELLTQARKYASWALKARLRMGGDAAKNERIRHRCARVLSGTFDDAVEVQSALLALQNTENRE